MSLDSSLSAQERSISMRLALIFALRMLGLFIVLPIFVPYVRTLKGGENALWLGLAMGAYGLTQAFLYIPYGVASDRFGRKNMITLGLLVFAIGATWAAYANSVYTLTVARALQGAGAISSVVVAMVADHTREVVRTRAMAMVGVSIALTFSVSLIAAPLLFDLIGMSGIFILIAIASICAMVLVWTIPSPIKLIHSPIKNHLALVLYNKKQWQLNFGVFVLHAVQMAMWLVLPQRLIALGIEQNQTAWLYAIVIVASMVVMVPLIIHAEKYHKMHKVMSLAITLVGISLLLLAFNFGGIAVLACALLIFFIGFNVLEAIQPSLLSKQTHADIKGAVTGVYNTVQALGLFFGAFIGALLQAHFGAVMMFLTSALLVAVWLWIHLFRRKTII